MQTRVEAPDWRKHARHRGQPFATRLVVALLAHTLIAGCVTGCGILLVPQSTSDLSPQGLWVIEACVIWVIGLPLVAISLLQWHFVARFGLHLASVAITFGLTFLDARYMALALVFTGGMFLMARRAAASDETRRDLDHRHRGAGPRMEVRSGPDHRAADPAENRARP